MREQYVQAYVDHYAKDGRMASGQGEYLVKLARWYRIGYTDNMTVLDYGCGWGTMVQGIKDRSLYQGVDIVPQAIELARETFPDVSFDVLEMGTLNIAPVDFVAAHSVFTHALREDVPDCLADIRRSMGPDSIAVIDILHKPGPDMLLLRHYDPVEWMQILDTAGLTGSYIETVRGPTATHSYYKVTKPV